MMDGVLSGRRALVTGASGGIGQAVTRYLAEAGADVFLHYHRHRQEAASLRDRLRRRFPERSFPLGRADLSGARGVERLFAQVREWSSVLDILVNGAGINRDRTLGKADMAEWLSVLDLNLIGTARACRAAAPLMREGGRIVNMASVIGVTGNFGQTNYAAAKAGVIGLTKALAQEMARFHVTVNAVAPGFVRTPMTGSMPERAREYWVSRTLVGRFAEPEEIAWMVLSLAAPQASYVTGTVIHVNGGIY